MEITVSQQQARVPVTIFSIKGEIDAKSYEQLEAQVQQAMGTGTRHLLLDLSQVPYISSYGIRGISEIFTWLRDRSEGEDDAALSHGLRDGKFKSQHLQAVRRISPGREDLEDGRDRYVSRDAS